MERRLWIDDPRTGDDLGARDRGYGAEDAARAPCRKRRRISAVAVGAHARAGTVSVVVGRVCGT